MALRPLLALACLAVVAARPVDTAPAAPAAAWQALNQQATQFASDLARCRNGSAPLTIIVTLTEEAERVAKQQLKTTAIQAFLNYVTPLTLRAGIRFRVLQRIPAINAVVLSFEQASLAAVFTRADVSDVARWIFEQNVPSLAKMRGRGWVRSVEPDCISAIDDPVDAHREAAADERDRNAARVTTDPWWLDHGARAQPKPVWGLDRIDEGGIDETFHFGNHTGKGVRIYVVDTGVRTGHVDFSGRGVAGSSWADTGGAMAADGVITDDSPYACTSGVGSHGTHCASTAAGVTYGVAKEATVVPVAAIDCSGYASESAAIASLNWVKEDMAAQPDGTRGVVTMSLGWPAHQSMNAMVAALHAANIPVVAAAGNDYSDACYSSPASAPEAITVGSTNVYDSVSYFTNMGSCVDIFAPGTDVRAALSDSDTSTGIKSGTSMATPHVAGVVAQMLQVAPSLSSADVVTKLKCIAQKNAISGIPSHFQASTSNAFLVGGNGIDAAALECIFPPPAPPGAPPRSPPANPPTEPPPPPSPPLPPLPPHSPPAPPAPPFSPPSQNVTIIVTSGSFPYEVSWNLWCADGYNNVTGGAPHTGFAPARAVGTPCTLEMWDSYGDGWNGATWSGYGLTLTMTSISFYAVEHFEIPFSPPSSPPLPPPSRPPAVPPPSPPQLPPFPPEPPAPPAAPPVENVTIVVTSGSYPAEVWWRLYCTGDPLVISGGAPYTGSAPGRPVGTTCTLEQWDSYGDGWNGATWTGYGVSLAMTSGYSSTQNFVVPPPSPNPPAPALPPVPSPPSPPQLPPFPPEPPAPPAAPPVENATIVVTSGSFPGEVWWRLYCTGDPLVISGGAPYTGSAPSKPVGTTCTLEQWDSYGDGWNGATWTGYGVTFSMRSGTYNYDNFEIPGSPPPPPLPAWPAFPSPLLPPPPAPPPPYFPPPPPPPSSPCAITIEVQEQLELVVHTQQENALLKQANTQLRQENVELRAECPENTTLLGESAQLRATNARLRVELSQLQLQTDALQRQLRSAEEASTSFPLVSVLIAALTSATLVAGCCAGFLWQKGYLARIGAVSPPVVDRISSRTREKSARSFRPLEMATSVDQVASDPVYDKSQRAEADGWYASPDAEALSTSARGEQSPRSRFSSTCPKELSLPTFDRSFRHSFEDRAEVTREKSEPARGTRATFREEPPFAHRHKSGPPRFDGDSKRASYHADL